MMKKLFFLLKLLIILTMDCVAQQNEILVIDQLKSNYNNKDYNKIYEQFETRMQSVLSENQTKSFFTNLEKNAGVFKTYELVSDNTTHKTYKVQFLKVTMKMNWLSTII